MPRRGGVTKREVLPDPMYNSVVVTKLINLIMIGGKRGTAQRIVYDAFSQITEKTGKDAVEVFEEAMNNIMPVLEVKAAEWAEPPIRCRSKSGPKGVSRSESAGWWSFPGSAASAPWTTAWPQNSLPLPRAMAER